MTFALSTSWRLPEWSIESRVINNSWYAFKARCTLHKKQSKLACLRHVTEKLILLRWLVFQVYSITINLFTVFGRMQLLKYISECRAYMYWYIQNYTKSNLCKVVGINIYRKLVNVLNLICLQYLYLLAQTLASFFSIMIIS